MPQDNVRVSAVELSWWLFIAVVILVCLGLYARYAPRTQPVIHPVITEGEP
jgi:hypothetical protein